MVNIRLATESDLEAIKDIHDRFYKDEFEFVELLNPKSLDKFVITDENDKIITFGTNSVMLEMFAITDKRFFPRVRYQALTKLMQANMFSAGRLGFNQLHCFIQDPSWLEQLKNHGFKETRGKSLIINI